MSEASGCAMNGALGDSHLSKFLNANVRIVNATLE
jgi:hypothetical protein